MATPEPYPYRKLNYPINNLEQSFTQEQKLQTRSNIGIPSSVDEEGKVLMVDNAAGELVWAEAPNGLPDIASGDEGKFLSVENGEPTWSGIDFPEQVNADWTETDTTDASYIKHKPTVKPVVAGDNITITEGADSFVISADGSGQQVQADWTETDSAEPSYIQHKPDLSIYAESSDLATVATTGSYDDLSDKPTIPPAQVNSDWNASSGVAEILNKPNLSTVATTGDYDDLVNKPSIPAAQVNADWTATSGVAEILHKPTLAAVATSGDYADLSNTPSIPTATSDLTNDSGFITLSNLPPEEVEVLTYGTSTLADYIAAVRAGKKIIVCKISDPDDGWRYVMQSESSPFPQWYYTVGLVGYQLRLNHNGVDGWTTLVTNNTTSADAGKVFTVDQYGRQVWAAAQGTTYSAGTGIDITSNTISVENPLPASTSAEAGKYLKVDSNGDPTWATGGGGGGGVNADWTEDDPLEPSYIENKPTPKTLTAGANISISEGVGTLTISAAAGLPASTSADEGKCLVVDSNGDPEWGTGGKTYTGTDGVVVDNVNDTVGLEAPVDIVAGPGISIDNPDGNTLRVSQAANYEVALWANSSGSNASAGISLSESPYNFDKLSIQFGDNNGNVSIQEIPMESSPTQFTLLVSHINNAATNVYLKNGRYSLSSSTLTRVSESQITFNGNTVSTVLATDNLKIYRVIGIHRINGGN